MNKIIYIARPLKCPDKRALEVCQTATRLGNTSGRAQGNAEVAALKMGYAHVDAYEKAHGECPNGCVKNIRHYNEKFRTVTHGWSFWRAFWYLGLGYKATATYECIVEITCCKK